MSLDSILNGDTFVVCLDYQVAKDDLLNIEILYSIEDENDGLCPHCGYGHKIEYLFTFNDHLNHKLFAFVNGNTGCLTYEPSGDIIIATNFKLIKDYLLTQNDKNYDHIPFDQYINDNKNEKELEKIIQSINSLEMNDLVKIKDKCCELIDHFDVYDVDKILEQLETLETNELKKIKDVVDKKLNN